MKVTSSQSPLFFEGKQRLLGVTLRAQPRDAAVAVHPFVNFAFAFEPRDLDRLDSRILGKDIPVALGNPNGFEGYFGFAHAGSMPTIRGQIKSDLLPAGEEHTHESALSGKVIVAPSLETLSSE
jgi:hypothetical protein